MNPAWLLLLAVIATALPDALADMLRQSRAAWFYVLQGLEATILWLVAGSAASPVLQAISAYGAMEGAMRSTCRLALPMDRGPSLLPGQNLCDVAFGWPVTWLSIVAALFVALFAQEMTRGTSYR